MEKSARAEQKSERELQKKQKEQQKAKKKGRRRKEEKTPLVEVFAGLSIDDACPVCHGREEEEEEGIMWVCCDKCNTWYHFECVNINDDDVPETFLCFHCM